jgi:hypothetical protein
MRAHKSESHFTSMVNKFFVALYKQKLFRTGQLHEFVAFNEVPREADYKTKISKPMSINDIFRKVERNNYERQADSNALEIVKQLLDDIDLIRDNCHQYNTDPSLPFQVELRSKADKLQDLLRQSTALCLQLTINSSNENEKTYKHLLDSCSQPCRDKITQLMSVPAKMQSTWQYLGKALDLAELFELHVHKANKARFDEKSGSKAKALFKETIQKVKSVGERNLTIPEVPIITQQREPTPANGAKGQTTTMLHTNEDDIISVHSCMTTTSGTSLLSYETTSSRMKRLKLSPEAAVSSTSPANEDTAAEWDDYWLPSSSYPLKTNESFSPTSSKRKRMERITPTEQEAVQPLPTSSGSSAAPVEEEMTTPTTPSPSLERLSLSDHNEVMPVTTHYPVFAGLVHGVSLFKPLLGNKRKHAETDEEK